MSHIAQLPKSLPPNMTGMEYGEPVLFKLVAWMMLGPVADGYSLNVHPVAWAAWWGMLVTAINLFPFSQLDGGHISYAVFGRASSRITLTAVGTAIALVFVSRSWIVWTLLLVGMLIFFGPHHPQTLDEDVPLDRRRKILAAVALIIFILCFTPAPIQPLDLLHK
jgi:membrane-associated protease RseP (regulator of RpoE activity)